MTADVNNPPDGGWGWLCVAGKLYCYFITLGLTSAFGVVYVELIDYFNSTREEAAWIGSLSLGLTLMSGPLSSAVTSKLGIQKTVGAGSFIASCGCFISSFASGIPYLYVTYGVVMGLGLGLIMVPCNIIILHYFKARLGLANAIGSAGNGIGTLVLPPLYTYLLEEYGWRGTLMLLSGFILNGLVCAFIFLPPSYMKGPSGNTASDLTKLHFCRGLHRVLCKPLPLFYNVGLTISVFGYSIPFLHLPDMAIQIGIEKYQTAFLISIMGIAGIFGRIVFGLVSDLRCVNVILLQGLSLIVCAAATAVSPHLTEVYAQAIYSAIYGMLIGAFISIITLVGLELVGLEDSGDFIGITFMLSGITNTMASPVAGWLFDLTKTYNASFYFSSSVFFLGGVIITLVWVIHAHKSSAKKGSYDIDNEEASQSQPDAQQTNTHL